MAALFMGFSSQPTRFTGMADPIRNQKGIDLLQFRGQQAVKGIFQFDIMVSPTAISHAGRPFRESSRRHAPQSRQWSNHGFVHTPEA
jgi:hypothetical protein